MGHLTPSSYVPVSYTHLDVYKRQVFTYTVEDEDQLTPDFLKKLEKQYRPKQVIVESVSYTHLEVPQQAPATVPTASDSRASFMLGILPSLSVMPAREAVPDVYKRQHMSDRTTCRYFIALCFYTARTEAEHNA